jgi:hypothetical protein
MPADVAEEQLERVARRARIARVEITSSRVAGSGLLREAREREQIVGAELVIAQAERIGVPRPHLPRLPDGRKEKR